jgi:hypothetical protein
MPLQLMHIEIVRALKDIWPETYDGEWSFVVHKGSATSELNVSTRGKESVENKRALLSLEDYGFMPRVATVSFASKFPYFFKHLLNLEEDRGPWLQQNQDFLI